ncbi:MAG: OmpA family protein [Desulfobacterales bacterium]|nr:OmpA family protein [Desulfobacterales bacterium]
MKAIYRAALMAAAFLFLLPLSVRSEIRAGSFELSPFVGYNFFEDRQNLNNRPVLGGRLGYNFTQNFGIEAAGEYISSSVDDKAEPWTRQGQFTSPIDSVDITFYHLDLLYHLMPKGNFNPFIVAGYGAAHYSPEISTRNLAIINFGLGAKYWLADNIAIRFDLRDNMVYEETIHNIQATLGIVFAFGGKAKPAPAPVAKYEPKPEPRAAAQVVILASEPMAEEKIIAIVSEPKAEVSVVILAFEDVHFDFDQSTLTKKAQGILQKSIQLLKDNPKAKIRIAGYTSASGTEEYNQKLSERRAKAVYDYLIKEGLVSPEKLTTIGYGKMRPAVYEPIPANIYSPQAKANMRVLFEVIVK